MWLQEGTLMWENLTIKSYILLWIRTELDGEKLRIKYQKLPEKMQSQMKSNSNHPEKKKSKQ